MRNFCFWTRVKIFPNKKMRAKNFRTHEKCRTVLWLNSFHIFPSKISYPTKAHCYSPIIFLQFNGVDPLEHRLALTFGNTLVNDNACEATKLLVIFSSHEKVAPLVEKTFWLNCSTNSAGDIQ